MAAAADRMEASRDDWTIRHRLVQRHHSLAVRRSAWFTEVERGLAEEIARRTGLDPDLDTYSLLVVTSAIGATAAISVRGKNRAYRRRCGARSPQLAASPRRQVDRGT